MRFKREISRGVIILAAVLVCAQGVLAQQLPAASARLNEDGRWVNGVTESWWLDEAITKAEGEAAAARWEELGGGLARAGGWAGDYFRGSDTHGTYMRWSPRGFVIARVNKCMASVMGLAYGRVEATPTLVQFFPELDKESAGGHGGHHGGASSAAAPRDVLRFVPVEWRGRRLLIAEREMGEFGDYVAGLGGYNGEYVLRFLDYENFFRGPDKEDKGDRGVGGRGAPPVVPPGYEHFIKKPIEARVTSVGRRVLRRDFTVEGANTSAAYERAAVTHVTINAGSEQGVKEGLVFRVTRPDEGDTVIVRRAGRRTSEAVVVREIDRRGVENFHDSEFRERQHSRVARGWRLTTSLFD